MSSRVCNCLRDTNLRIQAYRHHSLGLDFLSSDKVPPRKIFLLFLSANLRGTTSSRWHSRPHCYHSGTLCQHCHRCSHYHDGKDSEGRNRTSGATTAAKILFSKIFSTGLRRFLFRHENNISKNASLAALRALGALGASPPIWLLRPLSATKIALAPGLHRPQKSRGGTTSSRGHSRPQGYQAGTLCQHCHRSSHYHDGKDSEGRK